MKEDVVSNCEFLKKIFLDDWRRAWVTGFPNDPSDARGQQDQARMWAGREYGQGGKKRVERIAENNTFFCVSVFHEAEDGRVYRRKSLFDGAYVLMADDIGTKVDEGILSIYGVEPTAIIETSPGNFQYFYAFESKETRQWVVEQLQDGFVALDLCEDSKDPGMKGVTRYGRLPRGVNNKRKYTEKLGIPFEHKLTEWNPDVRYTPEDLAAAFQITLVEPEERARQFVVEGGTREWPEDYVLEAIEAAGLIQSEHVSKPGAFDILCPWQHEHTGGDDTGTAYFRKGYVDESGQVYDTGGFKCHHGHCEDRSIADVYEYLVDEGYTGIVVQDEFEPIELSPKEKREEIWAMLDRAKGTKQNPDGSIKKSLKNVHTIISKDPAVGKLEYNVLKNAVERDRALLADTDEIEIQLFIEKTYKLEFSNDKITRAVAAAANENRYDPVIEYLEPLKWDGVPRLDTWLIDYAGAEDNDYIRAVCRKTLVAAVARSYEPGCKFDYMTVLEGAQGLRKSTMLAALVPKYEWFMDTNLDIGKKDAFEQLQGKLIIEHAELAGSTKADVRALKSFLTTQSDYFRPSYARHAKDHPRHCIFFGSTNDEMYLKDETGGRRFWPVKIQQCDPAGIAKVRDQLWAEAVVRYHEGEPLFMSGEVQKVAEREADARFIIDEWENDIRAYLDNQEIPKDRVAIKQLAWDVFSIGHDKVDRSLQARIGQILRRCGWVRCPMRRDGKVVNGFKRGPKATLDKNETLVTAGPSDEIVPEH